MAALPIPSLRKALSGFVRRPRHHLKWALIHCALMFFFADLLSAVWPAFAHVWDGVAHLGVAVAAFAATIAEYLHDEEER